MNNDRSDDSDDSEGYSERIKFGETVDEQAMGHEGIFTRTMVLLQTLLQTLLKNEKEGCSVFYGVCSEKGIWDFGELRLEQLFSIEKLALYGEVHIAECFLVGLSFCRQELEQGESEEIEKGFSCWIS